MADTQKWMAAIEQAIDASQRPGGKPIRTGMLDVVQSAYQEGLREATDVHERRKLVAMLAMAKPDVSKERRDKDLKNATDMVEILLATVK